MRVSEGVPFGRIAKLWFWNVENMSVIAFKEDDINRKYVLIMSEWTI